MIYPYKSGKEGTNFEIHDHLSVITTLIDKSVSQREAVGMHTDHTELIVIGTQMCQPKEVYYWPPPLMDACLIHEIEVLKWLT